MKQIVAFIFYSFLAVGAVFAQTAAILPQGVTQYFDNNGNPLTSGRVYNYIPGTLTFKTTWQDSGETIANTNPVVLDAAGRAKILGSGAYRQIVRKSNGDLVWDAVTTATGSGGGGGTGTGDGDLVGTIKPWAGLTAPNQYVFTYGQEISRTTYSSLLTAITQTISNILCTSASATLTGFSDTTQINIGAPVEISCMAAGTIVLSKTSSTVTVNHNATGSTTATGVFFPFGNGDGSTTFNVPDLRGYVLAGRDNMGGIAASRLTTTYFGSNSPDAQGGTGGSQSATLSTTNLPNVSIGVNIDSGQGSHTHTSTAITGFNGGAGSAATYTASNGAGGAVSQTPTIGTSTLPAMSGATLALGDTTPFTIVQPTMTLNYIIKVTPDTNSASASGVTSIESMTGAISCGAGLTCTGNTIDTVAGFTPSITSNIEYVIDGGGSTITTGVKGDLEVSYACTIIRATALADQTGSLIVDIWKDTYANYPPTISDSIVASAPLTISGSNKIQDSTLTGWTTSISSGDTLRYNINSAATITRATISITCRS